VAPRFALLGRAILRARKGWEKAQREPAIVALETKYREATDLLQAEVERLLRELAEVKRG
jgi:hypothetical protein